MRRNVNKCCTFGNCRSPRIWCTFIGLVIWVAIYVIFIILLFVYMDDVYGWDEEGNRKYYPPYDSMMPGKQVELLELYDYLAIPHKREKQVWGLTLAVIGFKVDPNAMTVTMPPESKAELIQFVQDFIQTPNRRRTLHEFQKLAGWINWLFNVFPLLKPCLSSVYDKMRGKEKPNALIYLNEAVKSDLRWFLEHVKSSSGVYVFDRIVWKAILSRLPPPIGSVFVILGPHTPIKYYS